MKNPILLFALAILSWIPLSGFAKGEKDTASFTVSGNCDMCKTRIEAGARVLENTVLGNGCAVERGAVVQQSILWDGAVAMRDTWLERCVVGEGCHVKTNAAIFDGVIVNPIRKNGNG